MIQIEGSFIDSYKNLNKAFWYIDCPKRLLRSEYVHTFEKFFNLGVEDKMYLIDASIDILRSALFYFEAYLTLIRLEPSDLDEKVIVLQSDIMECCIIRIKNLNETEI